MPVSTVPHSGITPSRPSRREVRISSGEPPQCQMSSLRLGKPIAPCADEPGQVAQWLLKIDWPSLTAAGSLAISATGRPLNGEKVYPRRGPAAACASAGSEGHGGG